MFKVRRLPASALALTLASASILSSRVVADQSADAPVYSQTLANLNVALAQAGIANVRVDRAEMSVSRDGMNTATTLIANNRTHQLNSQFVASDPRRGGFADLSYLVDQSDGARCQPRQQRSSPAAEQRHRTGDRQLHSPLGQHHAVPEPGIDQAGRRRHRSGCRGRARVRQSGASRHAARRYHAGWMAAGAVLRCAGPAGLVTLSSA